MSDYSDKAMENAFNNNESEIYGKHIRSIPKPAQNIDIDTQNTILNNIVNSGTSSQIDLSSIESFTRVSQERNEVYTVLDAMSEDSTVAAILETYAEDATEYNDNGRIMWVESSDGDVGKYITYLLDTMNVDKNIYNWAYHLVKYGDIYLKLFRQSDYDDGLFNQNESENESDNSLNEDVKIHAYAKNDKYVHYVEMMPNPAEVFELIRFGKTYAYIKTSAPAVAKSDNLEFSYYKYSFKKSDVDLHQPTDFVHGCLEDNSTRVPEEVTIFLDDDYNNGIKDNTHTLTYTVRRGQSLLYSAFKVWRQLTLLENSILLNRITKSSIVRMINVEVGDMPKENVGPHLQGIKSLIEQKSAINTGTSMNEYTNPGPIENNVYVPTHNGIGAIQTQQIGGDIDVKGLADLEYYRDKFFGCLKVPKQYFGFTEDGAGFNGGQSLSIISSRYAKTIKRIQNTLIQCITDAINLMLIDKGLQRYINKFTLKMLPPTTQEEIDRRENLNSRVDVVNNIMSTLEGIEDTASRLKILKSLMSGIIQDTEIIQILQDEIDRLEQENQEEPMGMDDFGEDDDFGFGGGMGRSPRPSRPSGMDDNMPMDNSSQPDMDMNVGGEESNDLPSPSSLGIDMTNNDTE